MTQTKPSPQILADDAAQNISPRRFRVLMVAPTSFFSDYGGHIRILEESYTLQELGQELAIVTYYKGSDMPGLDIRRTSPLPYRTDYEVGSSRHKLAFDVYLAAKTIKEGLRFRPDVIHGHMHEGALIGGVLAKMLRVPLVFDFQGSLTAEMVDHHFLDNNGRFPTYLALPIYLLVTTCIVVLLRLPDSHPTGLSANILHQDSMVDSHNVDNCITYRRVAIA